MVTIASIALGAAGAVLFAQVQPIAPVKVAALATNAPAATDYLKDRLELYDRRARDLQWILAALLATGALFTLLQGVFAFVSVQNFNSTVDATLRKASDAAAKIDSTRAELETQFQRRIVAVEDEAKSRIEDLRKKLEAQFPIAGRIEDSLNDALWLLDGYFQDADWYEDLYDKLQPNQRQQIVFHEKVIAGFASLNVPRLDEPLSRAFRGLGSFYTSRFRRVKDSDDLDRAKFYFSLAIHRSSTEFVAQNMLGYIALTYTKHRTTTKPSAGFGKALPIGPTSSGRSTISPTSPTVATRTTRPRSNATVTPCGRKNGSIGPASRTRLTFDSIWPARWRELGTRQIENPKPTRPLSCLKRHSKQERYIFATTCAGSASRKETLPH